MHLFETDVLKLELGSIAKRLSVIDNQDINRLVDLASRTIVPKAAYRVCFVEEKEEDGVTIEAVRIQSRVLRHQLTPVGYVLPFVLTIGGAVDALMGEMKDFFDKYILGEIANHALREFRSAFESHLCARFALKKISCMTPGSLKDWPIEGLKELFALLHGVDASLGVRLTDKLMMLPHRTVSGLYFPTESTFMSCQLCPRRLCEDRKARYDEEKARLLEVKL